jgi:hypothetical protein
VGWERAFVYIGRSDLTCPALFLLFAQYLVSDFNLLQIIFFLLLKKIVWTKIPPIIVPKKRKNKTTAVSTKIGRIPRIRRLRYLSFKHIRPQLTDFEKEVTETLESRRNPNSNNKRGKKKIRWVWNYLRDEEACKDQGV